MDQETFTNHLSHLSKAQFQIACRIVLRSVFGLRAINIDGSDDGGTDFISISESGERTKAAYQITTQKKDIDAKAYKDAAKAIDKLGAEKFYFLTTLALSETKARKLEARISSDLMLPCTCFGSRHIAAFILEEGYLNQFLDEACYPLPRGRAADPHYREMALHAYTLMSKDARDMRTGIYDDTIVLMLSDEEGLHELELIHHVQSFLGAPSVTDDILRQRIGALFGRNVVRRLLDGRIALDAKGRSDVDSRKRLYEGELTSLAAAQIDLMRTDFTVDWSLDDSRAVSVFIADVYIARQIEVLKDVRASIVIHPLLQVDNKGLESLKRYLRTTAHISPSDIDSAVAKLIELAAYHPLIHKLGRASVYIALEGANPIVSAKALGAARWSDYNILLEPTVAIPWICSQLYKGKVNRNFDASVKAVERLQQLDAVASITYSYINECAGHLLLARRYSGLTLSEEELRFSRNAYVANYYSLKLQGVSVPDSLLDYLKTFSPTILISRSDVNLWIRSIMTDLQTILNRSGVMFSETPHYEHQDCAQFEQDYAYYLKEHHIEKLSRLVNNDVWALQFTNDSITHKAEHWLILTHDRSLISLGKSDHYRGWIASPERFLEFTETQRPLAEARYISLLHSVASFSERTLSAGARIIDRVVQYASNDMQNWEFMRDFNQFRKEAVTAADLEQPNALDALDQKTDEFLTAHGIQLSVDDSNVTGDL